MTVRDVVLRILWDICFSWPEISEGILLYLPSFINGNEFCICSNIVGPTVPLEITTCLAICRHLLHNVHPLETEKLVTRYLQKENLNS
jgi:hypothetical protein